MSSPNPMPLNGSRYENSLGVSVGQADSIGDMKKYDNDLNNAVCAFFDNPDALRAQEVELL